MSKRRLAFLSAALLLTVFLAGLAGTAFERQLESFESLGVSVAPRDGGWIVERVDDAGTGLRRGDVIVTVDGEVATSFQGLRERLRARDEASLLVLRPDEAGPRMTEIAYQRPGLEVRWSYLALVAVGVFYLLVGLITAFKDHHLQARLFFLWCLASAAFYVLSPVIPPADGVDELIYATDQLARLFLPALTLHLFLVFPTRLVASPWLRRLIPALYVPSAFLGAFHVDQVFFGGRLLFGAATPAAVALVDRLELIYLVGAVCVAVLITALRFRRRPGWEHRRQVQWILAGLVGGFAPFTVLYLLPWSLGLAVPRWIELAAVVPLILVPLAFAWAILRYKLLDLEVILRDVAAWTATGLIGIFAFQLVHLLIQANLPSDQPLGRNLLTFAAGLVLAGVLVPTQRAVSGRIESWQHGGRLAARRRLRGLGHELLYERDLDRLCGLLIEGLEDALVVRSNLYLVQGSGGLAPVRVHEGIPRGLAFDDLGEDAWGKEVHSISALELPGEELSPAQRLFLAGHRYAFPVTVRGHRLGVLVMGYKYDEEPLSGEDVELVRSSLDRAALAIENAQLLDEVQHQLAEVSRLEAYNEGILESSPAGIAVIGGDDRVSSSNHAFAALCGRERPEVIGTPIDELIPVRPLPKPGDGVMEVSWCEPSGEERYLLLSVAIWAESGQTIHDRSPRVLVVQDVSARVGMEQELKEKEHLASLGVLAAGVAHEVNTPLTGISSYAQFLLADTPEDDPHYTILKKMERQTFRAAQIVNNLLDFARNRHGDSMRVRFGSLVGDCLHLLEERADRAGVDIDYDRPQTELEVVGNESELHQVVTNLVVNALDAMAEQSEPRLVRVRLDADGGRARLRVSDSGPGVPKERLDTIFKPFFSSKLEKGGSGLGLAITYNIVRRHGGEIGVRNHASPRRGCTFAVELPLHEGDREANGGSPAATDG